MRYKVIDDLTVDFLYKNAKIKISSGLSENGISYTVFYYNEKMYVYEWGSSNKVLKCVDY